MTPDYPHAILDAPARPARCPRPLAFIDRTWHAFAPAIAIQRTFLDDRFRQAFPGRRAQGEMFGIFVAIAIFIACLGLFGLAAFTAERRTKEIGIRKVFGARTRDIVLLLLWQFSIPVLIANADRLAGGLVLSAWLAAGLCLSHHPQPALFPGRGRCGAGDRLGDGLRPCPRAWPAPIPSTPCATSRRGHVPATI